MQLWYQQLFASMLMQAERTQIDKMLSPILGEQLLQIGGPSEFSLASPVRHKIYLADHPFLLTHGQAGIMAEWAHLPLYPGSIDLLLLVHALEFVGQSAATITRNLPSIGALWSVGLGRLQFPEPVGLGASLEEKRTKALAGKVLFSLAD